MSFWRYAAGQSTGSAHEKLGSPCQDRFRCETEDGHQVLIAVVSDGAGTAEFAHIGAEIAVDTIGSVARLGVRAGRQDLDSVLREGATLARQRLIEAAASRQVRPRDLACTALAVILTPMAGAALQIGDGAIVIAERESDWRCVFWPQKGEYANSTFFLSDEQSVARALVKLLGDDVKEVALFSDGLEQLALHFASRSAHAPFFRSLFAPLRGESGGESQKLSGDINALLASAPVRARTDDDATLVLACRR
jgi:Protein phosphatase 2C